MPEDTGDKKTMENDNKDLTAQVIDNMQSVSGTLNDAIDTFGIREIVEGADSATSSESE